jgi:hypothetical protein
MRNAVLAAIVLTAGCVLAHSLLMRANARGCKPPPSRALPAPSVQVAAVQHRHDRGFRLVLRRTPTLARGHAPRLIPVPDDLETQAAANSAAAERMFSGGLTRNFGDVRQGTQLLHRFPITNVYSAPVTIAYLQPSCDCVTAAAAKLSLQPGESTTVDVRLDAGRFSGSNEQNVRVKVAGPDFESTCKLVVSAVSQPDAAPAASAKAHAPLPLPASLPHLSRVRGD